MSSGASALTSGAIEGIVSDANREHASARTPSGLELAGRIRPSNDRQVIAADLTDHDREDVVVDLP